VILPSHSKRSRTASAYLVVFYKGPLYNAFIRNRVRPLAGGKSSSEYYKASLHLRCSLDREVTGELPSGISRVVRYYGPRR
jgi:hypothetical protein